MNRLFLLLFGMVTFVAHAQVPNYVPTEGLVGWWPLEGNAEDAHQNMNGVVYGASEGIGPNDSPCLNFDGVDDYVEVPTNPTLESIEDELTISCWFLKSNSTNSMLVVKRNFVGNPNGERHHFEFAQVTQISHDRAFHFSSYDNSDLANHNCQVWTNDDAFDYDVWTHASVTFANGLVKFFVDGFQIHEHDCGFQQLPPNNHWLNFARMHRSGGVPFSGELEGGMQNVGIWNRALTEEEIFALYNAEPPVPGCTDPTACNFDAEATSDDGSCIPSGCMEPLACNYNALAECAGEVCDYACCPGPGCCADGTSWDYDLGQCVPDGANDATANSCPQDLDFDGVVGVGDLMDLLSVFGTDCPTNFTCGDPINYHGYDYATVLIGEQCWFAENLRAEQYQNGDEIPGNLNDDAWTNATEGAQAILNENEENLDLHGRLYNFYAVLDERGLCPAGWHVPADEEWITLGEELGGIEVAGTAMKNSESDTPPWDGTNSSHWNGSPGGKREMAGWYGGNVGYWWTSTPYGCGGWHRNLHPNLDALTLSSYCNVVGFSVRCLKDQ